MKNLIKKAVFGGIIVSLLSFASPVFASTPLFSVTQEGSGDNVRITISNANSYSQITLYRRQGTQLWTTITNFGQTDGGGYYSTMVSLGSDGSNNPVEQYVVVGGLQSSTVSTYPYGGCSGYNCGNYGNITFSETNPSLSVGQSRSVSIYGDNYYYGSGNYYISSNSNSNTVSASISGSTLNLYAYQNGNSTITVCQSGSSSSCGSLYVTVSGGNIVGNITFSPQNPSLNVGQSLNVYVSAPYLYSGSYYISSNSNSNIVSASISGSTISLYGKGSGNSTITVCQSGYSSSCGSIYVTVSGGNIVGNITFSPQNPSLSVGQSMNVSISAPYYYSGSYYVSSNSNSGVVSASISGTILYLYGNSSGNSTINVCQSGSSSSCGSVYVTVGGGGGYYGSLTLSQSNLSLSSGQSAAITIYGGYGNFYISNNTNSNVASGSISGDKVNIYGYTSGSTTMTICSSNYSSCASLYVTVGGGTYGGYVSITNTSLPTMVVGQYYSVQLQASGGVPSYKYEIISGALPAGLSLSESGLLSGVPQYAIAVNFGVRVKDSQYSSGTAYFSVSPSGSGSGSSGGGVLGTSVYKNGQLIKEDGTVYIVYKNTKTGFTNSSAFTGLGFSFNNVVSTGYTGFSDSGFVVKTSRAAHPWGSWVKSGQTVYFVHELGLIPVPSMDVFTNNGGQASLIVPANSYDFSLPVLSPMVLNDSKMR